jgi:hypothetical protein
MQPEQNIFTLKMAGAVFIYRNVGKLSTFNAA